MPMNNTAIALLTIMLTACAPPQPQPLIGPNGKPAYVLECLDQEKNCEKQAGKLCPKGYTATDKTYRAIVSWQGFAAEHTVKYNMTIECNE